MTRTLATVVLVALSGGCGPKGGGTAVPTGTYQVDAPVCASTGLPPAYPSASYKLALFAFDGLTAHSLAIAKRDTTETYLSATCELVVTRGLFQNADGGFGLQRGGRYVFLPAGCTQTLVVGGVTYQAGPSYSDAFAPSSDGGEAIPFSVIPSAGGYLLESADTPDLDSVWLSYGCAKSDRLQINLRRGN